MTDLNHLLDQIDRLDGELLPDWKYNDRTGAVIANAYRKQGDKWSCLVAKGIPADRDGEFIALARTALPKLAAVIRRLRECAQTLTEDNNDASDYASGIHEAVECLEHIIKDALGDDDA